MADGSQNTTIHIAPTSVVKIILIVLLFAALFVLRDLLLVVIAAVVIASAIEPMTKWFVRRRIPRLPAVLLIYVILAGLLAAIFYFLVLPLLNEVSSFLSSLPNYVNQIELWGIGGGDVAGESQPVVQGIQENLSLRQIVSDINTTISNLSGGFVNTISTVFGGLLSFLLIIVLSFYLAVQEQGIARFLRLVTPRKHQEYIVNLWKRSEAKIGLWLQGQLILVVIIGVLTYLGLLLLGVEHALLLATLAGLFELIPLFGPILAAIPAVALAFVDGGATLAILVAGFYIIIQQFENHLIYPVVVRKVVGLPAIIVILALIAGGQLAGFLGILLSVPVAAVLMEIFNDFHRSNGGEELPEEPAATSET